MLFAPHSQRGSSCNVASALIAWRLTAVLIMTSVIATNGSNVEISEQRGIES